MRIDVERKYADKIKVAIEGKFPGTKVREICEREGGKVEIKISSPVTELEINDLLQQVIKGEISMSAEVKKQDQQAATKQETLGASGKLALLVDEIGNEILTKANAFAEGRIVKHENEAEEARKKFIEKQGEVFNAQNSKITALENKIAEQGIKIAAMETNNNLLNTVLKGIGEAAKKVDEKKA